MKYFYCASSYSFGMTPEKESVLEVTYDAKMSFNTLLTLRLHISQNVNFSNSKIGDSVSYFIFNGNALV